jgi:hypothetical protein
MNCWLRGHPERRYGYGFNPGVVRVRHDHNSPLDIAVRDHGNHPPPRSGQPVCGTVPLPSDQAGHVIGAVSQEDTVALCPADPRVSTARAR